MAQELFPEDETEKTAGGKRKDTELAPPYISYLTFTNCLDWLKTEHMPSRFDRSFWSRKYSGSLGPSVLSALRFLGLLDSDNIPKSLLEELVKADQEKRKELLRDILRNSYKEIEFDKLNRATPQMFQEMMAKYHIQASTSQKAKAFLINAIKAADIPISPLLQKAARNRPAKSTTSGASNRKAGKPKGTSDTEKKPPSKPGTEQPPENKPSENVQTINLKSGGTVTLEINVNLFALSDTDRNFVFGLIDSVQKYQANPKQQDQDVSES